MTLPIPSLDDRRFQDIVDEAKKRIPQYSKEWTDHNVSDPGITMIELFAWMTDMMLYRLNQVPRLHYIKMLDMLGIQLHPPRAAQVPVTFWLSAPQSTPIVIPAGTEVSTTQTETERAIIFTTKNNFHIAPPKLEVIMSEVATQRVNEKQFVTHNLRLLSSNNNTEEFEAFSVVPQVNDALYFGFATDLSHLILGIELDCRVAGGAGIDPTLPPYVVEAAHGQRNDGWELCEIDVDSTGGMNRFGRIQVHLPTMNKRRINGSNQYWVRLRIKRISTRESRDGMRPYDSTPKIRTINTQSWGGTIASTHTQTVEAETLGRSDGTPGQRFRLRFAPVLKRTQGETVQVNQLNGEQTLWHEVNDFSESTAQDHHFALDSVTGELRFPPAVRQQDGHIRLYGEIPARNATILFTRYRTGGGRLGNIDAFQINTLKSGIPFVDYVTNREPATGGLDAETIESAMMRAPSTVRTRDRAMTSDDFEFLAMQALPEHVARVKALQARPTDDSKVPPGQVYVLVIPKVNYAEGYLSPAELTLQDDQLKVIVDYLDERRLLTTRLVVRTPAYRWVSVRITVGITPGEREGDVEREVLARLYRTINPLTGGPDGNGWPFGRHLFIGDLYQALQNMRGVSFMRSIEMYVARPSGERVGSPIDTIDVVSHGVIVSGIHEVVFVS